jgi:hypothetical protein
MNVVGYRKSKRRVYHALRFFKDGINLGTCFI